MEQGGGDFVEKGENIVEEEERKQPINKLDRFALMNQPQQQESEESSEEEEEMEGVMMWDDDEQYVPPVINNPAYFDNERPQIFGNDDGYNSLVFSTEDLKQQYHALRFVSKEWTQQQAPEVRQSLHNIKLKKLGSEQFDETDFEERRERGVTMGTTLADEQRNMMGKMGENIMRISKTYKTSNPRVITSQGPMKNTRGKSVPH